MFVYVYIFSYWSFFCDLVIDDDFLDVFISETLLPR